MNSFCTEEYSKIKYTYLVLFIIYNIKYCFIALLICTIYLKFQYLSNIYKTKICKSKYLYSVVYIKC